VEANFFNGKCERIVQLKKTRKNIGEMTQLMDEFHRVISYDNNMNQYYGAADEALEMIKEIGNTFEEELKNQYCEDEMDPEVDVWRWILVVPWWRIIFEFKRFQLDKKEKEKEKAVIIESKRNESNLLESIKLVADLNKKGKSAESMISANYKSEENISSKEQIEIPKRKPIELSNLIMNNQKEIPRGNAPKKEIEVDVKCKIDGKKEIPIPIIKEKVGKFEVIAQDQLSVNLFVKKYEVDPVYKMPEDLSCKPRKISKEEEMEEAVCFGNAMGTLEEAFHEKMLPDDIYLKGI
jgi:hypothetical protein